MSWLAGTLCTEMPYRLYVADGYSSPLYNVSEQHRLTELQSRGTHYIFAIGIDISD